MDILALLVSGILFVTLALFLLICYTQHLLDPEVFYVGLVGAVVLAILLYCQSTMRVVSTLPAL